MRPRQSSTMSGFTLVEVLVSTALLASVFVAVVSLASQSLRNLLRLEPHEIALLHARERMNGLLLLEELQPGQFSGSWPDGYRWEALIVQPAASKATGADYQLFEIRVVISWSDHLVVKHYAMETRQWAKLVRQNANR